MARKPPANFGCEAIVGWDSSGHAPVGIRCKNPGIERQDMPVLKWFTILCDGCYGKRGQGRP